MLKIIFDELDESFDDWNNNDFEEVFDNSYANKKYIVLGSLGLWDGTKKGYSLNIYSSIKEAIQDSVEGFGACYIKVYEKDYGRLYLDVAHHDGTNYLEIREISKLGEELLNNNKSIGQIIKIKGATKNSRFCNQFL